MRGSELQQWGPERVGELVELCAEAMPGEALGADELALVCWQDPSGPLDSVVLGTGAGDAAVAATVRQIGSGIVGFVRLAVVAPQRQREAVGGQLMAAAEAWLAERGATTVALGGEAPVYLWPGVDAEWTSALCLAESRGYAVTGAGVNMVLPVAFAQAPPSGVSVRALQDAVDIAAARKFLASQWPHWLVEMELAVQAATAFGAFDSSGAAIGFCAHSVLRYGWLGPMATSVDEQGRGVGGALVSAVCRDMSVAGWQQVQIAWVGPVRFYAKLGATVSRCFLSYSANLSSQRPA